MAIDVHMQGDMVIVDGIATVAATSSETWAVLTDYDHMAEFLPNLESSKKIEDNGNGNGNEFQIAQKGKLRFGPFSLSFSSLRKIILDPDTKIVSSAISGNFRKLDSITQLSGTAGGTRIDYHVEAIPDIALPDVIAVSMARKSVREFFDGVKAEIERRKSIPQ